MGFPTRGVSTKELERILGEHTEKSAKRSEKHLRIAANRLKLALMAIVISVALQVVGIGVNVWLNLAD